MIKQVGDYRNVLGQLYGSISVLDKLGEEKYRFLYHMPKEEYLFSNIQKFPLFEERYSFSQLKEIMSVTTKKNLKEANYLIKKINSELVNKSEDSSNFKSLMNKLCISLDGRRLP